MPWWYACSLTHGFGQFEGSCFCRNNLEDSNGYGLGHDGEKRYWKLATAKDLIVGLNANRFGQSIPIPFSCKN